MRLLARFGTKYGYMGGVTLLDLLERTEFLVQEVKDLKLQLML